MRDRTPLLVAVALALLSGCASHEAGPELWRRACTETMLRVDPRPSDAALKRDVADCVEELRGYPARVADRSASCMLRTSDSDEFSACVGSEATRYFDLRLRAEERLEDIGKRLREHQDATGEPPRSLAELEGAPTDGIWGAPLLYRPEAEDRQPWTLCDRGPDGAPETLDDICSEPAFIYFQF